MQQASTAKIFKSDKKVSTFQHIGKKQSRVPVNKDSIEGMTPETDRMVSGVFRNIEYPGQTGKVTCRLYKDMEIFSQTFEDGKVYSIPLSVARFINRDCAYAVANFLLDEDGNYIKGTGKQIKRYQFTSQEYN